jgi:hydrogenase nickel incorporation protein HypB
MKEIEVVQNVLEANDSIAARNREVLDSNGVFAINLMSAPGAGKTSLILRTIDALKGSLRTGVVEGDVASSIDSDKLRGRADAVIQITTRYMPESCSLIAHMLDQVLKRLPLKELDLLIIENVGNLICPSEFALGEHRRVVISSLPEGDDKPIKYPIIFADADVVLLNKMDFLPYVEFDVHSFQKAIAKLNPRVEIVPISCKTGEGIDRWCEWLVREARARQQTG